MKKKVAIPSEFGSRNVWCRDYSRCLNMAIESGAGGFSCQGCQYEHDHTGVPQDQFELAEDCRGCMALLASIFQRITVQEAISRTF